MENKGHEKEIIIVKECLAQRIKELRKKKGITQEDLEEYSNVSRRNIGYIENAKGDVKLSTLIRLSQGLKVSIIELFAFVIKYCYNI